MELVYYWFSLSLFSFLGSVNLMIKPKPTIKCRRMIIRIILVPKPIRCLLFIDIKNSSEKIKPFLDGWPINKKSSDSSLLYGVDGINIKP
ncbi:hypothetical protein [Cecembia sp.]|uniref:hypothetical protein n=1 Tax=Cecembia sp. TaxID=1898110 RepID=UPI0025BF3A3E|nr:hypothetical protein [Cecembia sp.]